MKSKLFSIILAVMMIFTAAFCAVSVGAEPTTTDAYSVLNNFRTQEGVWCWNEDNSTKTIYNTDSQNQLQPLKRSEALETVAQTRAKDQAQKEGHTRPDGKICFSIYPSGLKSEGENIFFGMEGATIQDAMEMLEETQYKYEGQGHRRNMLNPYYNAVGIGSYTANGNTYWVMAFGQE